MLCCNRLAVVVHRDFERVLRNLAADRHCRGGRCVAQRMGQQVSQCSTDQAWITPQLILSLVYQLHISLLRHAFDRVIALEVGGGLLLITGWQARWAALALALFLIPTTLVFHAFWAADAAHYQDQLTNFLKNLSIFGGMLLLVERGFAKTAATLK